MGVDEWRAHIAPISIVKQLVYCLPMLVNWLNTNFGIALKLGEHGNGWHSSCMNFVGLGPTTMMILIGNKPSLGKGFLRSLPKKSRFGAFSKELLFWTKWIECNDRVFNHEQWHESKVKHIIWDDLDMYAKVARERFIKFVKICVYSMTKRQGLGMSFVGGPIYTSFENGKDNVAMYVGPLLVSWWHGGCPWLGGLVSCPWWGLGVLLLLRGNVVRLRLSTSPRRGHIFLWFLMHLALTFWPFDLLSHK